MKVQHSIGERGFKFGGGTRLKSKGEYNLPAVNTGKEVIIKTDVVKSDTTVSFKNREEESFCKDGPRK